MSWSGILVAVLIALTPLELTHETSDTPDLYPRNVVLIIGDGMGLVHIGVAIYSSKDSQAIESFPVVGLAKTASYTNLVTDSGAAATAMACGEKTYNSSVGMLQDSTPCRSLIELAEQAGKSTGVVVTSSLAHATPASFVAHQRFRGFREAIADDYLKQDIDYIVGGGLMYFTQRFTDSRNLLTEFEDKGYTVSTFNQMPFKRFMKHSHNKALYVTAQAEPQKRMHGRDYFPHAARHGLETLKRLSPEAGFFMMMEGSQIDFAGHENNQEYLRTEMVDFNEMLVEVLDFARRDGETLVIVTADHSTGGLTIESGNAYKNRVKMSFWTSKHTADMVPVFAYGPGAELFGGIYENTEIFKKIRAVGNF